jgi:hypothetical protein
VATTSDPGPLLGPISTLGPRLRGGGFGLAFLSFCSGSAGGDCGGGDAGRFLSSDLGDGSLLMLKNNHGNGFCKWGIDGELCNQTHRVCLAKPTWPWNKAG